MPNRESHKEELKRLFIEEAKNFLTALEADSSMHELQKIRVKVKTLILAMETSDTITQNDYQKLREIIAH